MLFNNREEDEARLEDQVHDLLDQVHGLYRANGQQHYKSDLFAEAERAVSKREKEILEEAGKAHESDRRKVSMGDILLERLSDDTLKRSVAGSPELSLARMVFNAELKKGPTEAVLNAVSYTALARVFPSIQSPMGSVYFKSRSGERVKDSADLEDSS